MTWIVKHKIAVIIAGVIVFMLWKAKASQAAGIKTPPAVAGTVISGHQFGDYDLNILSPTFGEPIKDTAPDGSGWFW